MGIMVYSLYWVMQDFVHQQYHTPEPQNSKALKPSIREALKAIKPKACAGLLRPWQP